MTLATAKRTSSLLSQQAITEGSTLSLHTNLLNLASAPLRLFLSYSLRTIRVFP
jgi:hypothetical protein